MKMTLKNPKREIQLFSKRILWIAIGVATLTFVLFLRLTYLQIFQHRLYMTLSQQNQFNVLPIEPNRGLIFDRRGVLVAENVPTFNLEIIPYRVQHLDQTLDALSKIISISEDDLDKFYRQLHQHRRFEPVHLRTRLTEEEVARFSVDQYRFPGVFVKAELIRRYPLGQMMVPVLGYVGRINEKELKKVDASNYSVTNYIGKLGIEKFFEDALHGKVGYEQVETDATGRVVRILKSNPPTPGENLYLTIDSELQKVAYDAFEGEHGALVVINPNNGQILAMVSVPSYDPHLFVDGINKKTFQALQQNPDQPLYDRAIRGQYPMASTIKSLMALEGLESGKITPFDSFFDPGWFQLKNSTHVYRDWKAGGHGVVTLNEALAYSCDTYFFNLAHRLGIRRIDKILDHFGFGKKTNVEIKEELPGIVPSPEWKRKTQRASWYPGDTIITAIGQGFFLATPLQLAAATATMAAHGARYRPTLLLHTQYGNDPLTTLPPESLEPVILQENTWKTVIHAMEMVIKIGTGTLHFGNDTSYSVAGKTGTAQVFSLKKNQKYIQENLPKKLWDHGIFTAFAPVDNPRIAIAVVSEHSKKAGNIARKVMDYYFSGEKKNEH